MTSVPSILRQLADILDAQMAAGAAPQLPPLPASPRITPTAADYRLSADEIVQGGCVGRHLYEADKRWTPAVYRETQCQKKPVAGSDLCKYCTAHCAKAATAKDPAKAGCNGRITEEPPAWSHMLGTEWAEKRRPVFTGIILAIPAAPPA